MPMAFTESCPARWPNARQTSASAKALGATAWQAAGIGARDVAASLVLGTTLSVPVTMALTYLVTIALPGAARFDVMIFGVAVVVAVAVTAVATAIPLHRAIRLEPLAALRTA
jgi:ABC-type antimicrobial peptide transport system permease subunit